MNANDDWAQLDATAQAELVAAGRVSPYELVAASIERIERLDGRLGAVPVRRFEQALESAAEVSLHLPFAGVPFLMKDVGARQAGQPYYAGNRALRDVDHRAASDTPLGARFRALGLVTLGNSNTPEFGMQSNTWPLVYGPARNPWDPARSAGGSSGGACAAVAAGLVPIAHASDGAGSIRIPAAWCGLIGLKPSRDRVIWRHAGQLRPDVEFAVARSLRDTAALLDALRPKNARDAEPCRFARSVDTAPRILDIAFCLASPDGTPVHESCVATVASVVAELDRLGHRVVETAPAALFQHAERGLHGAVLGSDRYRECLEDLEERLGRPVTASDAEPFLWELSMEFASQVDPADVERSIHWLRSWERDMQLWFEEWDVLVTPSVPEPAPRLESLDPRKHTPLELLAKMAPHMAFTEPWNATGQPAISLPLGSTASGLPVGVQLVGRPGAEADLLSLSAQLLARFDASGARPPIHA